MRDISSKDDDTDSESRLMSSNIIGQFNKNLCDPDVG